MKFYCKKSEILKILSGVKKSIPLKSPLTVLEGFLLQATDEKIIVSGYNMEFGIKASFPAKIEQPGSIVLNARLLTEIIKKLPGETVVFDSNDNLQTQISCEQSRFNLIGLESSEYPKIPQIEDALAINVDYKSMKSMIEQTIFAVSTDAERLIYTGVLLTLANKTLKLVAIDGYRLALRQEKIDTEAEFKCVVPGKVLAEVLKLLPENIDKQDGTDSQTEKIKIFVSNTHILLKIQEFTVISRLLNGEFTDYKKIISQETSTKTIINTKSLIECFERVSLLVNERLNNSIRCLIQDSQIKLICKTTLGNAEDSLNCEFTGENLTIGLNHKYMIEALKNSDCEQVNMEFNGPLKPVKITPINGDKFTFIVLPVRLKD